MDEFPLHDVTIIKEDAEENYDDEEHYDEDRNDEEDEEEDSNHTVDG